MKRALAVLRPEPGNAATAARIDALGLIALRLPLFEIAPLDWAPPDPTAHDALILTSANTLRHGGVKLAALRSLPVYAVGAKTADSASAAGFEVVAIGEGDAAAIIAEAEASGISRALYLGGRHRMVATGGIVAATIPLYANLALPISADQITPLRGNVVLLHSTRAASAFSSLAGYRPDYRIAALSRAILSAAGPGWDRAVSAPAPSDAALLAAAITLAD